MPQSNEELDLNVGPTQIDPQTGDVEVQLHREKPLPSTKTVVIPFQQGGVLGALRHLHDSPPSAEQAKYKKLIKIKMRFSGLCEIISNYVIIEDLLGQHLTEELLELQGKISRLNAAIKATDSEIQEASNKLALNPSQKKIDSLVPLLERLAKQKQKMAIELNNLKAEYKRIYKAKPIRNVPLTAYRKDNFELTVGANSNTLQITHLANHSPLENQITLNKLKKVEKSHIIQVSSLIQIFKAYCLNIYPNSLFSKSESPINKTTSKDDFPTIKVDSLKTKLDQLESDSYVKFFVFKKGFLSMEGHSMVIKKTGDNQYIFFDPNYGEYRNLSFARLHEKLNHAITQHKGTHVAFIDAKKYINSLTAKQKGESPHKGLTP